MKRFVSVVLVCVMCAALCLSASAAGYPFTVKAGDTELEVTGSSVIDSITMDGWTTYENVTVYTVEVPVGTQEVTVSEFQQDTLCYNYDKTGTYVAGVYDDVFAGIESYTMVLDADDDGELEYTVCQAPYDADYNTEMYFFIDYKLASSGTYTVKEGDCLWSIARELTGSGANYTELFAANADIIENPELIYAGQVLTLPW